MSGIASNPLVRSLIDLALLEDIGSGDITTERTIPEDARARGILVAKEEGVLAGLPIVEAVFQAVDSSIAFAAKVSEGERFTGGTILAELAGPARAVLTAERTALNFLQQLTGIATTTATYVAAVSPLPVRVIDTRKTIPGWRTLSKYAVRMGGGHNHRFNLSDAVLIKDNHLAVTGSIREAVRAAREGIPHTMRIEVEVDTLDQLDEALDAGADIILLDNMSLETMREAVRRTNGRALLEASGGIRLETIRAVAETGVDLISTRAITADACTIDIGLDLTIER